MISYVKQKLHKENYKKINDYFPGIEGALFQDLDHILVMAEMVGKGHRISNDSITLSLSKGAYVRLDLCFYNKRMIICMHGVSKGEKAEDVYKEIKVKFNLTKTNNRAHATYNGVYEFKYNQKNCKRVLNLLKFFVIREYKV
ncbi:MAG: hypothetical protein K0R18_4 [Bacillales bacterium]|nr:hypothetical protein [Bacillales bacterium]